MSGMFRAYDIRGIYGQELTEEIAAKIGAAFGTINKGTIAVGCDARLSSPDLKQALTDGLASAGCNVLDIGMITTPMMIFAVGNYGLDGGIMVTASHNPKEYNGFKIFVRGAHPVSYESGLGRIEKMVKEGKFHNGSGHMTERDITDDYSKFLLSKVRFNRRMKVVVDAGNGAAGKTYPGILRKAGFDVTELFCEPDGNFPNHVPDPTLPENIVQLKEKVKETKADIGLAFDGDGDRLVVVDGKGEEVDGNDVFVILARQALQRHPNGKIIINIACSMAVDDEVKKRGGIPIPCKVGHTYITQKMAEVGGVFAGEISGHYFFKETFMGDDGLLASLRLLESLNGTSLERERASIPHYFSQIADHYTIPVKEELKESTMGMIKEHFRAKGCRINDLDGAKVMLEDGWILFRPSNTTPLIRYGFEARTREGFERIRKMVEEVKGMVK